MKSSLAACFLPLTLLACGGDHHLATDRASFVCPDGTVLLATFYPDQDYMQLRVNDRSYDLPRLISASGARYGDDTTIFWNKGREAMLQLPSGRSYFGCATR